MKNTSKRKRAMFISLSVSILILMASGIYCRKKTISNNGSNQENGPEFTPSRENLFVSEDNNIRKNTMRFGSDIQRIECLCDREIQLLSDSSDWVNTLDNYEELLDIYDRGLNLLLDNQGYKDHGILLFPFKNNEVEILPIRASHLINAPVDARYETKETVFGYVCLVSDDLERIFLSTNHDYAKYITANVGDEFPIMKYYHLLNVKSDKIKLAWASLPINVKLCRGLLDMFSITHNDKYLLAARKIMAYLIDRIDNDGKCRVPFPNTKKVKYRAIYQSYLMQILLSYLETADQQNGKFETALETLANSFSLTHEGTRNHWAEAEIGRIIISKLGLKDYDYTVLRDNLKSLYYNHIKKHNGKIPYTLEVKEKPILFKPHYQCYDTMLLAQLAAYSPIDIGLKKYFPSIFNETKKVRGETRRSMYALYYAKLSFGFDDKKWAFDQEAKILKNSNLWPSIPPLLKYKILTEKMKKKLHPVSSKPRRFCSSDADILALAS